MLVRIDGPFGGGKTQTAFELHRRLPGSPQVAERVARAAGLTIAPATGGALRARLRRGVITMRHIRGA